MDGRDGRGGRRSYREAIGTSSYSVSSSSGTVSTAYTSSGGSQLSSILFEFEYDDDDVSLQEMKDIEKQNSELDEQLKRYSEEMKKEEEEEHIISLVQEFFGATSALCSINGGDISVLERWFTELGVGWVLHIPDGEELDHTFAARSWIRALTEIVGTVRSASRYFERSLLTIAEEELATEREKQAMHNQLMLARFTRAAILKLLPFVDAVISVSEILVSNVTLAPLEKLQTLLAVRDALSHAFLEIGYMSFHWRPSAQVKRIQDEMVSLLSASEGKTSEAIRRTMKEITTQILESMEDGYDSWRTQTPQGSSDIHKATRSVACYIRFLDANYWSLSRISNLPSLTMEVIYLEEKLAKKSQSFPDQSLRFLFLINNSYFLWQQFDTIPLLVSESHMRVLTTKIEDNIQNYLQVSWAPVLSCLSYSTPICYGRYSPLPKFELEFHKTYATQKLWKVPDPKLRKKLRKAITEKVISGFTKYLEDYSNATAGVTPQELEEMLQGLFEG